MSNNTSKPSLALFNPDHDLALANGDPNYMPSAPVRQMMQDLALLPVWYTPTGDRILASSAYNREFLSAMQQLFPGLPGLCTPPEIGMEDWSAVCPWGWDQVLCRQLQLGGIARDLLPDEKKLAQLRVLSHRLQAVALLPRLREESEYLCGESFYLTDEDSVGAFVGSRQKCVLKAPLSGSGKGLNWCKGLYTPHIRQWSGRVIRQQGGVVAEPVYDKEKDFAMGFYSDGQGEVQFRGYSVFRTTVSGAYEGNELLSDAAIEKQLGAYIPLEVLWKVREQLQQELSVLVGSHYKGYLGVDMMVCRFASSPPYRIHPCVEINLRMSMGMVARLICNRFVDPHSSGVFRIDYYASADLAREAHQQISAEQPPLISGGRLVSGYLPLVPLTPHSRYRAWITVQPTLSEQAHFHFHTDP